MPKNPKKNTKKNPKKTDSQEYTAKDIFVLKGLEPVRKRPAMYIGSTGPDGLHHLIWECLDNSVTYETPIYVKENGKIKIRKIGELIDKYFESNSHSVEKSKKGDAQILRDNFNIEVLSFDPLGLKLKFQPIFSLIRHKVNSEIFRVTLQNNRQIDITPYHSLFTLKNGKVLPIKGDALQTGASVVVPKTWPEVKDLTKEINLIDEFLKLSPEKTKSIHLYNVKNLLGKKVYGQLKVALKGKAGETASQHPSNIFYDYKRWDYLPFNLLRELSQGEIQKFKGQALIGVRNNSKVRLNPKLKITRPLIELLGLFAAEGTIVENNKVANRIVFSLGAHEYDLIKYACRLIEKVVGIEVAPHYVHDTARTIAIDSHLMALIFKEIIKTGENSSNKNVPDLIFNLSEKLRKRYLIAYLSGDGNPTKIWIKHLVNNTAPNNSERTKFNAVSKSKDLISELSYLLSSLNKTYSYGERVKLPKKRFISITYKGRKKTIEIKAQTKFFTLDFYWGTNSSYINYLPFNEVVSECFDRTVSSRIIHGQNGISGQTILSLLEREKVILKEGGLKFLNSDLGFLRVKKVEKINYGKPWVYDVSVPNGENFVAGLAPVCAHNSIDEAMVGYADDIGVLLLPDNQVRVTDNGRGIPVDIHPQTKVSALETVLTTLHAGAKFGKKVYQVSGGLHGVGVSVVCALSSFMRVEVCRDDFLYTQEYSKGTPKAKVKKEGKCSQSGTTVIFQPDKEIFRTIAFDRKTVLNHLRRQAYLTKGVRLRFEDRRTDEKFVYTFCFEGGLRTYTRYLAGSNNLIHETPFYTSKEKEGILVEAAFQYTEEQEGYEESFANNIFTLEGGSHLTGFRSALTRVLNDYAKKNGYLKEDEENLNGRDVRVGLNAAISVKIKEPQFEGQTKTKLGNPEAKTAVEMAINEAFTEYLEQYPQDARAILQYCLLAAKARKAATAARQTVLRKGALEGLSLPGKLADCSSKDPAESEIFIVEGQSAGGCFSGNTKIALTDGRDISFKELISEWQSGKDNYCYTIKEDGNIGIEKIINPRLTKKNEKVLKIILDNNEEIVCTIDHKFMLRNGEYKEAKKIKSGESLMPFRRKISQIGGKITIDGYEMIFDPAKHSYIFTHLLADKYNTENNVYAEDAGLYRHHIDFDKKNNNPNNLNRLSKEKHLRIHRDFARLTLHRPEVIEKCRKLKQEEGYRKRMSVKMKSMRDVLSERAKKQWENPDYKEYMRNRYLEFYYSNEEYRKNNLKRLYEAQRKYWADEKNLKIMSEKTKNYFKNYPEKKKELSLLAKEQWDNEALRKWRSDKTKAQWTKDFREKRKLAYNKVYFRESMNFLKEVYDKYGDINHYDKARRNALKKNTNLLKMDTLIQRFFDSDKERLSGAIENFNHKVKRIEFLKQRVDVYDIEVPKTHNFALAGGVFVHNSAKSGRDRRFQAILPLRGKILNVERAKLNRMLSSDEIKALVIALGTAIAQDFDISKLRYHRVVIMTDADVDGAHIRTLLLTLFYRHLRPVIEQGYLYIAQPPLYKIQDGKRMEYAYNEADKTEIVEDMRKSGAKNLNVQRYKGLGEMNADQLWETTMNPANRSLLRVSIADAKEADNIFDILMGEEVLARKKFIQTHAKYVKNLDI
ncbi:hypothetical protein KJ616_01635 [Patescibacteria group bacterium]|nr:hypothetical protein [Patescibacteria group bacterium]